MKIDFGDCADIKPEQMRAALAALGRVLDGRLQRDGSHRAVRVGGPMVSQFCAEPGCARLPAVRLDDHGYCATHALRRMETRDAQ